MKFPVRITAVAASVALAAAVGGAGAASASSTVGVGSAAVETNLLNVNVAGGLLGLKVVSDQGKSNVDPAAGSAIGYSALIPLALSSNKLDLINQLNGALGVVNQKFVSQSPGGAPSVGTPGVNFASPGIGVSLPVSLPLNLLSGQLNAGTLTSSFDAVKGATSALNFALTNLNVAGGLLTADTFNDTNASGANSGLTNGSRTVNIGTIKALNLGALLQGLGINPTSLPLSSLTAVIDKLGLPLNGLPTGASGLTSAVTTLLPVLGSLTGAQSAVLAAPTGSSTIPVPAGLDTTVTQVNALLGGALPGGALPSVPGTGPVNLSTITNIVNTALPTVNSLLANLLGQGLNGLLNTALLQIDGAQLGVVTKAAPKLADSTANIVAQVGAIKIGALNLPGLDLSSALSQVTNTVNTLNNTVSGVLGAISPNLANLVHVAILDQTKSVVNDHGYNKAGASVTAVSASIDPSAILGGLGGLVSGLTGASAHSAAVTPGSITQATSVFNAIHALDSSSPAAPSLLPNLTNVLGVVGSLLGGGATTVKVGEIVSGAQYASTSSTPAVTPVAAPNGALPRTGSHTTEWAAIAAVLFALALGVRRFVRRPVLD